MAKEKDPKPDALAVTSDMPAHLQKYDDKTSGFEDMDQGDILFPKIRISQPSSDVAVAGDISPGIVYEDVGNSVLLKKDEMTEFAIIFWFKSWVEWGDRDSGEGALESSVDASSVLASRFRKGEKKETKKGLQLAVTEYHNFIVMLRDEPGKLYQLSCFRTGHKHGKKLLNLARMREAPMFTGIYTMATKFREKESYKWYEWLFDNAGWTTAEEADWLAQQHAQIKELHEQAKLNWIPEDDATGSDSPDEDAGDEKEY